MEDGLRPEAVRACVQEFLMGGPRLERLKRYYDGRHDIESRERASGLPNYRLAHDYPRYISTMAAGYLIGRPVSYEADGAQQAALDEVMECYRRCAADSVDVELARSASIFGRGVELVFADEGSRPRTAALDPRRAFVVYDDTVENRPMFGVRLLPRLRDDGAEAGWCVEAFTDRERMLFQSAGPGDDLALVHMHG